MDITEKRSFFVLGISFFIAIIVTIYATQNIASSITFYAYIYSGFIILTLLTGIFISQQFSVVSKSVTMIMPFIMYTIIVFVIWLYIFIMHHLPLFSREVIARIIIIVFLFFNGFAIFYNVLISPLTTKSDFFTQLFFFIPCMITDGLKYLLNDIVSTPYIIFVLIFLELLFVGLYLFLPMLLMSPTLAKRISVLNESVYLDYSTIIANSELFHVLPPNYGTYFAPLYSWIIGAPDTNITFNKSYTISFWAYINSNSMIGKKTIFNYGNGKPALFFENDDKTGHFIASFTNVNSEQHTLLFKHSLQKWNYFVYTFINGTCEFFVNGELLFVAQLGKDQPTYHESDVMSIGDEHGLYGSVCNVSYFMNPISKSNIITTYNLLSMNNPPIFLTGLTDNNITTWYDYFNLNLLLKRDNTIKSFYSNNNTNYNNITTNYFFKNQ
jgi:hypothetical protein